MHASEFPLSRVRERGTEGEGAQRIATPKNRATRKRSVRR
jgi:hypothetical protein